MSYVRSTREPPATSKFVQDVVASKRLQEAEAKLKEFPERVPVIVEPAAKSTLTLDKRKFLVPGDATVGQFLHTLKRRIRAHPDQPTRQLSPDQAIFVFVEHTLPVLSQTMRQLYAEKAASDRFLYMEFDKEATFGSV